MRINYSVKSNIIGKPDKSTDEGQQLLRSMANGWEERKNDSPSSLLSKLFSGYAVAPGTYTDGIKDGDHFEGASLVFLDFDNCGMTWEQAKENEFFKAHAWCAYTSPSHGINGERFRVVGRFSQTFTDIKAYKAAREGLATLLPATEDSAMRNPVQACFGNPKAEWHYYDRQHVNTFPIVDKPEVVHTNTDSFLNLILKSEDHDERVAKAKLCLKVIPPRGPSGSGTWPDARLAVGCLVNEFGPADAFTLMLDCKWEDPECDPTEWDLQHECYLAEKNLRGEAKLGTLIARCRELLAKDLERLDKFNERLDKINTKPRNEETRTNELSPGERIAEILTRLVELELDISRDNWAEQQALMKEACALGPSKSELNKRLFDHICAYLGVDLGSTKGNQIKTKGADRLRRLAYEAPDPWLIPGYLKQNRDAILFGDSGTGKTAIALDAVRCMLQGRTFADAPDRCNVVKRVLFIASDGGPTAEKVLGDYMRDMGILEHEAIDRFDYWAADCDDSAPSWNLKVGNLIKLRDTVASGEYDLVIIDSLKSVTAQSAYSIDDRSISDAMRLVQAIVTPHAGLLWIHHTNKSNSSSHHSAGGCTDIIEVVSAAFQIKRVWNDTQTEQKNTMVVHKLRGANTRSFEFDFNFLTGVTPTNIEVAEAKEIDQRQTLYPSAILVALRDAEFGRLGRDKLSQMLNVNPNTLDNYTQELKAKEYIKKHGTGYQLTREGKKVATALNRKQLEACMFQIPEF